MVYLVKMPWRLASKGYNLPKELGWFNETNPGTIAGTSETNDQEQPGPEAANPKVLGGSSKTYILAGHSQGAKMAAQFVYENPGLIDKLILLGSSHPRDISLAAAKIKVLKIYGSNDGVADETSIMKNKANLPASTQYLRIEGANHAQFGYYGYQLGDHSASISREQQQAETLKYIGAFIKD